MILNFQVQFFELIERIRVYFLALPALEFSEIAMEFNLNNKCKPNSPFGI